MANVTIRNLDAAVLERLKARAKANHRSLEAELRWLLTAAVMPAARQALLADAERIAALTPDRPQTDSAKLLRKDRRR